MSDLYKWFDEYDGPKWLTYAEGVWVCGLGFNRKRDSGAVGVQIEVDADTDSGAIEAAKAEYEFLSEDRT
jgi:hypothetical protein